MHEFESKYYKSYMSLSKERSVFFSENVTVESAADLSALLLYYDHKDRETPIKLYINSNGGDIHGLFNIYDVMQMISAPVHTICLGKAYSAGAVMLATGKKGNRYAMPNSKIMIHGIQCGFPILGDDISSSKSYHKFLEDNNDNIMKILANHTNHTLDKIKSDCVKDLWLDPKQAIEYGLIDKIIGEN